jgi:GDP-mannose 4,6-dehydratase
MTCLHVTEFSLTMKVPAEVYHQLHSNSQNNPSINHHHHNISSNLGQTFVTRKITRAVANISLGRQDCVYLGNIEAKRDWGHARDYVEGMYLMLQQEKPEDFVLATGETHTVREFIEKSFKHVGMEIW